MKVAIWGAYSQGNYGDDLMAIQFALAVKRFGAHPVVYALDHDIGQRHGIVTTSSLDALLHDTAFCVYGGGSLLSNMHPHSNTPEKARAFDDFREALLKHKCPLHFLSIGGDDGITGDVPIAPFRERLLSCGLCRSATVRTKADCRQLVEHFGIPTLHYPDVLLGVKKFFNIPMAHNEPRPLRVVVNLRRSHRHVASLLCFFARAQRGVVLNFIDTVRQNASNGAISTDILPKRTGATVRNHMHTDPVDLLNLLGNADLVISHKLHVGLTAVALGVPFICLQGPQKSLAFLRSIGATSAYWDGKSTWAYAVRLLRIVFSAKQIDHFRRIFSQNAIQEQVEQSEGHLEHLRKLIVAAPPT